MKVPADFRYRCNNGARPREYVYVQDGWERFHTYPLKMRYPSRLPRMMDMLDPMTKDCRYSADGYASKDAGCTGCKWATN